MVAITQHAEIGFDIGWYINMDEKFGKHDMHIFEALSGRKLLSWNYTGQLKSV